MQTFLPAATNNHILSRLTADETLRLGPHLRHVEVKLGDTLLNVVAVDDELDGRKPGSFGITRLFEKRLGPLYIRC